jgi:hypothetical protein
MRTFSALAALLLLVPLPATAGAGSTAANAVVIAVSAVRVPEDLPGKCQVSGVIRDVREGDTFRPGQSISLNVPCRKTSGVLEPLTAPILRDQGVNAEILARSKLGFARIDSAGRLLWRPEIQPWRVNPDTPPMLNRPSIQARGLVGGDMGYVVLDGVNMPLGQDRSSVL